MGMMNAGAESTPGVDDPGPDGAEQEAPEAAPEPAGEPEPKSEPVKVGAPPQKQTRRQAFSATQEQLKRQIEDLATKASRVDEVEKSAAELRERLAKHEGAMEELRRQARSAPEKPEESYDDQVAQLEEKAIKALVEDKDWKAYQKIQGQVARIHAERLYTERMKSAPQPVHPAIPALEMEFHEVAAHPAGRQAALAFDQFLAAKGEPDNPTRWRHAYEMAARELGYAKPAPAADKKKEQALSGLSGNKGGGKATGAGRHVKLTQRQIEIAKKSGLGVEEYARLWADEHPEDVSDD